MNKKRIVINVGLSAIAIMRTAYAKVFQSLGWEVFIYNGSEPILDFFKKVEPSVYMFGSWELDRSTTKAIAMRPNLELIMWAPNWGSLSGDIMLSGHQVLMASPEEISFVEQIKQTNKLDYCFQYYHQRWMEQTHDSWRNIGVEPIGLPMAGCLFDYSLGETNEILSCDGSIVSGHWSYKAINLKKYIYPLANIPGFNLKVFGYGDWAIAQNIGSIATENMKHLFASSKVCLSCFEPLSDLHFDCSERIFKVMSAGGFCVSQSNQTAQRDIVPDGCIVWAEPDNPQDFVDKVIHYASNPEERLPFIKNAVNYAYTNGNYFARAKDMFSHLGWFPEVLALNDVLKNIQGQLPQIEAAAIRNHERVCEQNA